MAGLWAWNGSWREMKTPYVRDAGQWKKGKAAWVWNGTTFSWVQIWTGAVEIPLFAGTGPVNLRGVFDNSQFGGTQPNKIVFRLVDNATLGSGTTAGAAVELPDDWPWNPEIELRIGSGARIAGAGGDGGAGGSADGNNDTAVPGSAGSDGGSALQTRYPLSIDNNGAISGGGGGGGGGGGAVFDSVVSGTAIPIQIPGGGGGGGETFGVGGNAGSDLGGTFNIVDLGFSPAQAGRDGTETAPGDGGNAAEQTDTDSGDGGSGGNAGQAGQPGFFHDIDDSQSGVQVSIETNGGAGGSPGNAIDGASNVTFISRGAILGPEVN